jgi:aspartate racemase
MEKKVIGILGGMGTLATAHFFNVLVEKVKAENDQDFPRIIIDNNPNIPDRTTAIIGKGKSPVEEIVKTLKNLQNAGAKLIAMPCISAHYYFDEITRYCDVQMINMIEETYKVYSKEIYGKKVGLLATTGTVKAKTFLRFFPEEKVFVPDDYIQENMVMEAIYGEKGIKVGESSYPKKLLIQSAEKLINQGAEAIIAGCTEVSVILKDDDLPVHYLDPIVILAESTILKAGYQLK